MSLAVSQRRDQRRRLALSWNRAGSTSSPPAPEPRQLADYAPDALPERQPALATLVPTGLGGLALVAAGITVLMAAAAGIGLWETVTARRVLPHEAGRFTATIAAIRACLDIRSFLSLAGWLSQVCLVVATAAALVVRLMRRHRRDDYRGRYRAWGWLAALFTLTGCAAQAPIGKVWAAIISDATGLTLGPAGLGWWVLAACIAYVGVGLWAVLPLHERAATATWFCLCLAAWAVSAGCGWMAADRQTWLVIANAAWMAGASFAAIAMLAAARSVIREVRGLPARQPARRQATTPTEVAGGRKATEPAEASVQPGGGDDDEVAGHVTAYVDGSESDDDGEGRHLSKAERKRLRKLARMNRAA